MRKIWVVAKREYFATVRTKAFVVSVVLLPLMMSSGGIVSHLFQSREDKGEKTFVIVDRTPGAQLSAILNIALERRNSEILADREAGSGKAPIFRLQTAPPSEPSIDAVAAQRLELSDQVRRGKIAGFLDVGPQAMSASSPAASLLASLSARLKGPSGEARPDPAKDPAATRYQTNPTIHGAMEFYRWAASEIPLAALVGRASQSAEMRKSMLNQRILMVMLGLSSRDHQTGAIIDDEGAQKTLAGSMVGLVSVMIMFMLTLVVASPLMQGVLEEKMQRISEVLLGSLTPFELMAGKLAGGVGVAMTLLLFYVSGAYAAISSYGLAYLAPPSLLISFALYQTLAVVMYGSIFIAVGAACTDIKEPQMLLLPAMLPAMIPIFILVPMLSNPDAAIVRWVSFFPPSTPMLMIARQALSANIQWWEPVLGAVLVLVFTVFCVWAAGRIFRVGILMQGKGANLGEMMKWVVRG